MTRSVRVFVSGARPDDTVVAAVAELPMRAELADTPDGAVVVLPGSPGWPDAVEAARASGAAAVVVTDPVVESSARLDSLRARVEALQIVLDRSRLRFDVVADAVRTEPAPLYTVQCAATATALPAVLTDAVGWLRVLSGDQVQLRSTTATAHGVLALLDAAGGVGTLTATALADMRALRPGTGRIAAAAFGVSRTEVEVRASGRARVIRDDGSGTLMAPVRWEERRRLALRRVLDARESGCTPCDLEDFVHDVALAERMHVSGTE